MSKHYILKDPESGVTKRITARDYQHACEQAEDWAREGEYGDVESTIWVDVYIEDCAHERLGTVTASIDPPEPDCVGGREHEWSDHYDLVGGCKSNPGVFGNGGGVRCHYACVRCGCGRVTDSWAQRRDTGEQGLDSVEYEPGRYAGRLWSLPGDGFCFDDDEARTAWLAALEAALDEGCAGDVVCLLRRVAAQERAMERDLLDWTDLPTRGESPKSTECVWTWTDEFFVAGAGSSDLYAEARIAKGDG